VKMSPTERKYLCFHNSDLVWNNLFILHQLILLLERSKESCIFTKNTKSFYRSLAVAIIIRLYDFQYIVTPNIQIKPHPTNKAESIKNGLDRLKLIDPENELKVNYLFVQSVVLGRSSTTNIEYAIFKYLYDLATMFYSVPLVDVYEKRFAVSGVHFSINHHLELKTVVANSQPFKHKYPGKTPCLNPVDIFDNSAKEYIGYLTKQCIPRFRKLLRLSYIQEFTQTVLLFDTLETNSYRITHFSGQLVEELSKNQKISVLKRRDLPHFHYKVS
ncbi:MAG: hypothetical protein ACRCXZ_10420, partial [Patescibacteria group bacterium]